MPQPATGQSLTACPDLLRQLEELQREVTLLRQELRRAEQLATIGTLGAMVAHEVSNLMTPIINYAQLAQASPDDEELVAKALERAVQGGQQAAATAGAILQLARGDADSEPRFCKVRQAVEDAVACVPRGTRKGVSIRVQCEPHITAAISATALQQIVLNLLLNAIKAMGQQGHAEIRVREAVNDILLEVEDDGPGVPHEMIPLLFRPFAAKSGYGTGLGLSICDRLARHAGGKVWLDRPGGPGAKFCVRVPRGTPAAANAA
jgi:signal transduction histidine kinase